MKIYRTCKKQNSFFFYQNLHRKSTFYNINASLPISCKEDYPYSTITIKAQMLEGRYKNSEGSLGDGGGTTRGDVIEKREKNWTSRKKEANCVEIFLFLFVFFFFWLFFHLVLSISYQGWTYEVSQRANLPIFYLSSFLGSCEEIRNRGDIEGKGEHWMKGGRKGGETKQKWRKRIKGEKEGECLQRFPSNFSNLIKSYPVWKLSFVPIKVFPY